MEVVGEAVDSKDLWAQLPETQPDLLLLDWELPGSSPDEILFTLRMCYPHLAIIALSGRLEAQEAALDAGVDAFISKAHPVEHFLMVLQTIWPRRLTPKAVNHNVSL